jgi:transposase
MRIKQTKLRTRVVRPNRNISFPIGTILAVDDYFEKIGFPEVFSNHKTKGININSLVKALLSYKVTENLSISRASERINRKEVLKMFELKTFEQRTLLRVDRPPSVSPQISFQAPENSIW